MNLAIGRLSEATQRDAALVEQSSAAAHQLRSQAESLSELISQFVLPHHAQARAEHLEVDLASSSAVRGFRKLGLQRARSLRPSLGFHVAERLVTRPQQKPANLGPAAVTDCRDSSCLHWSYPDQFGRPTSAGRFFFVSLAMPDQGRASVASVQVARSAASAARSVPARVPYIGALHDVDDRSEVQIESRREMLFHAASACVRCLTLHRASRPCQA